MGPAPDLLVLGHLTRDLLADGTSRLGGTALYAAVTAARLGYRAAIYTAASPGLDLTLLRQAADGVEVECRPAQSDTTFSNRYQGGRRRQFLFARAAELTPQGLPAPWRTAPLVLLGPVAQELAPSWAGFFPRSTVAACLQGWLRTWDRDGRVRFAPWQEAARWLPAFAAAFLSTEDVPGRRSLAEAYAAHCPLLILTEGARGATLYEHGRPQQIAAFPVPEIDPTGAGDVFAAAFLLRLAEGADLPAAARFAAATAALSVTGAGIAAIPDRAAVEALLQGRPGGPDVAAAA